MSVDDRCHNGIFGMQQCAAVNFLRICIPYFPHCEPRDVSVVGTSRPQDSFGCGSFGSRLPVSSQSLKLGAANVYTWRLRRRQNFRSPVLTNEQRCRLDPTGTHGIHPTMDPTGLQYLSLLALLSDWICFSIASAPSVFETAYPGSSAS